MILSTARSLPCSTVEQIWPTQSAAQQEYSVSTGKKDPNCDPFSNPGGCPVNIDHPYLDLLNKCHTGCSGNSCSNPINPPPIMDLSHEADCRNKFGAVQGAINNYLKGDRSLTPDQIQARANQYMVGYCGCYQQYCCEFIS